MKPWSGRFGCRLAVAVLIGLVAAGLSGCGESKQKWVSQTGADESQVSVDRAYCQRRADAVAGAEYEQDLSSNRIGSSGSSSVLDGFDQTDAKRYRRKLFASCMGSLGYKRVQ